MGYLNPLLKLPAAQQILARPVEERRDLARLFRELREEASRLAEESWKRRKAPMACYWRVIATYARHIAILLERTAPTR